MQEHYTSEDHTVMLQVIMKLYCCQSEEELVQNIDQFWIDHEILWSSIGSLQTSYIYGKVLPSNMETDIYVTICIQIHSPRSWDILVAE